MELITARLLLREFRTTDLDSLAAFANHPDMRRFEKGIPDYATARNFLERAILKACETPRTSYYLAITVPPKDKIIGRISLTSQNSEIREWEIGWAVRKDDWQKGYASEAAHRMLDFAFNQLNAHRVVAFCHAENTASVKVMKKISMKNEGCLRQTRWFGGCWADELVYSILESDFIHEYPDLNDVLSALI